MIPAPGVLLHLTLYLTFFPFSISATELYRTHAPYVSHLSRKSRFAGAGCTSLLYLKVPARTLFGVRGQWFSSQRTRKRKQSRSYHGDPAAAPPGSIRALPYLMPRRAWKTTRTRAQMGSVNDTQVRDVVGPCSCCSVSGDSGRLSTPNRSTTVHTLRTT